MRARASAPRPAAAPPFNYHHLYYFWLVAREGNITRAARLIGVTQPTISGQLRLLERALGGPLFGRHGRRLTLTEIGQVAYRYAEEIFTTGRELSEALQGRPTGRPLRFAVGVADSLPKLSTFRLLRPALALDRPIRLLLRIDKTDRLLGDLSVHALDLVLADAPAAATLNVRVFTHLLGDSEVTVFGTAPLARRYRRGFPRSLHGAPFLLQTENAPLRRSLDDWFERRKIRPAIVAEVEDAGLLQSIGQEGLGLFAAPSVVEPEIRRRHGVRVVGRLDGVRESFYAISAERKLKHPAVVALTEAARRQLAP